VERVGATDKGIYVVELERMWDNVFPNDFVLHNRKKFPLMVPGRGCLMYGGYQLNKQAAEKRLGKALLGFC